jgi:hypothetical protein
VQKAKFKSPVSQGTAGSQSRIHTVDTKDVIYVLVQTKMEHFKYAMPLLSFCTDKPDHTTSYFDSCNQGSAAISSLGSVGPDELAVEQCQVPIPSPTGTVGTYQDLTELVGAGAAWRILPLPLISNSPCYSTRLYEH